MLEQNVLISLEINFARDNIALMQFLRTYCLFFGEQNIALKNDRRAGSNTALLLQQNSVIFRIALKSRVLMLAKYGRGIPFSDVGFDFKVTWFIKM